MLCCLAAPTCCVESAAGRVGVVRVDMQGVQSLKGNNLVDAVYVYIAPASMEAWAQEQSLRQVDTSVRLVHQVDFDHVCVLS